MRREPALTHNSEPLIGPRKTFDSIYVFRVVAETSPEYLEASITNAPN
jgi:hypothetical protein